MPKIAVAGLTHGHVHGLVGSFEKFDGVELTAVADATPLLEGVKDRFKTSYTDWREMLASKEIDGLIVTSDSLESAEIAVAALEKGIPVLVEKPMAANVADADRMLAAAKASGKTLLINWPFMYNDWVWDLKHRIDAGQIGHVFHLRYRNGHHGPKEIGCDEYFVGWLYDEQKNGGGAIADFGSYGAALARYYFGMPETVFCIRHNATKDYDISDDHAILLLKYPKLTVSLEGTWATNGFDTSANPVVHGSTGTFGVQGNGLEHVVGWGTRETLEFAPRKFADAAAYFFHLVETGETAEGPGDPTIAADAVRILAAAIESNRTGCAVAP